MVANVRELDFQAKVIFVPVDRDEALAPLQV
jgi:hypothetical protein